MRPLVRRAVLQITLARVGTREPLAPPRTRHSRGRCELTSSSRARAALALKVTRPDRLPTAFFQTSTALLALETDCTR